MHSISSLTSHTYLNVFPLSIKSNPRIFTWIRWNYFQGDIIAINYNKKIYELNVLETKPAPAVSIIECDMNVEFEAPPGYEVGFRN